ncbi:MAG: EscU/YscU/HrcU family type III secretion system export apparatus switch protein, partial [Terriglobia bacterium]
AREKGQIARSKELPAALALITIVIVLKSFSATFLTQWRALFSEGLAKAHTQNPENILYIMQRTARVVGYWTLPCLLVGLAISIAGNLAQGGFVFATASLTPSVARLNPATNLQKHFSVGGVSNFLKSTIPMAVIAYLVFAMVRRDWNWIVLSTMETAHISMAWLMSRLYELSWKAGVVFLAWSGVDYLLQRTQLSRQLRMSRQEIVQENKDNIGNPQIKRRIRKIQLQMRRRMMMRDVQKATVVITNPSEYAIALKYEPGVMRAPLVVAKGRNLIAQQIRQEAIWHKIPIIENRPLAHALYRAVQVGQAIPPALYVAVAEILAFIFRTQARANPMAAARAGATSSSRRKA